jgi:parallel beta-helix repeat protein
VGVTLQCSDSVNISNNTISGNTGAGLEIDGSDAIVVSGNRIGVADNGSSALGNSGFGIHFGSCTPPSLRESPDPANTKVRAKVASSGVNITGDNRIAFNGLYGVALDSGTTGIEIGGNRIYSNGLKNIDLIHSPSAASTERPNDTATPTRLRAEQRPEFPGHQLGDPQRRPHDRLVHPRQHARHLPYRPVREPGSCARRHDAERHRHGHHFERPVSGTITVPNVVEDNFAATATRTTGSPETSEFSVSVAVTPTPALTVTPTSVNFGTINVGSSSSPSTIKLKSTGAAPWVLSSLSKDSCTSGQVMCSASAFICSTNCTTGSPGYATNAECTVNATYAPTAAGTDTTSIAICDNTGTPQFITLTGSAVTPPPPPRLRRRRQ